MFLFEDEKRDSIFDNEFEPTDRPNEPTFTWDWFTFICCGALVLVALALIINIKG